MAKRSKWHGTRQILQFNWPLYALSLAFSGVAAAVLKTWRWPRIVQISGVFGLGLSAFWNFASVVVSWWIYDYSPLMKWHWLRDFFPQNPKNWANFHAGLDESTPVLSEIFGRGRVFDFFDATTMTEPSITRARRLSKPEIEPEIADFRALPLENNALDAAFCLLAAHELRSAPHRETIFREWNRVLESGGQLVVVEHVRDVANFAAFGPGAFHFWSANEWRRLGETGFDLVEERRITPFVRVFVWRKR